MQNFDRIQDLFAEALEQPVHTQQAWLKAQCGNDQPLFEAVWSLVKIESQAQATFGESGVGYFEPILGELEDELEGRDWVGKQIGRYQVQKLLGHGGMGAVFMAEEQGATIRRVALKIVRRGMDTDPMIKRFKTERTILAALNHPNIARLMDAGVTEGNQPYFVMEYIKGQPIDKYCDANRLRIDDRLLLFTHVCQAVAFAHEHDIIHRDLKPGNILITDTGDVKLLDFGIAKVLDPKRYNLSFSVTRSELRLLTPEYAAPEQISGSKNITPAVDVYQLGVLLYELLTGHRPYSLHGQVSNFDVARIIIEQPPTRPATIIERVVKVSKGRNESLVLTPEDITASRRTTLDRLKHRLSGDVEYMLNKALAKKPEDRYTTAFAFAKDIELHLQGVSLQTNSGGFLKRLFSKKG